MLARRRAAVGSIRDIGTNRQASRALATLFTSTASRGHADLARADRSRQSPTLAAAQSRPVSFGLYRERRVLCPDAARRADRCAEDRAMPGKLDSVGQLLRRDAAALT